MHKKNRNLLLILGLVLVSTIRANSDKELLSIVQEELEREFKELSQQSPPAYYLAYRIDDVQQWNLTASFGNIIAESENNARYLTPTLRVGDNQFDNTHLIKGASGNVNNSGIPLPIENVSSPIKQEIWKQTDVEYKKAKASYLALKNKIKPEDELKFLDFSKESHVEYYEPEVNFTMDDASLAVWKKTLRACSQLFLEDQDFIEGDVNFEFIKTRKHFIASDGSKISQNLVYSRFVISGMIRSEEGNYMPLHKSFYSQLPNELPNSESLIEETKLVVAKLIELKTAPLAEPYTGPALLSPQASGVFFHEIFGHRVEGHRLKDENDGQTFKHKLGESVLPKSLSVTFDPTQDYLNNTYLIGHYQFDDEGVKSKKVNVVEKGVLKDFLISRTPIEGFTNSNGHGRASTGSSAVSRQSNMFVESNKPFDDEKMRKTLLKECKRQKVEYGYYFKEVTGGFTTTGRYMPNAFNVIPTEVYRVYVDGRPDELVRGVDLIGTPLAMFSEIKAAGDKMDVFTGFCGAESGWVPVSAASPSLFVRKVETQRKSQHFSKGILLPPPTQN